MLTRVQKLSGVLAVSVAFFIVEIAIGFKTGSLALIADADIVSYVVALLATKLGERSSGPPGYTFAFRRAETLGAFFNASFLLALALSIFLQSIERFINVPEIDHPLWVLIVGCCGLALNIASILLVHEHNHASLDTELSSIQAPGIGLDHSSHHHAQQAQKETPRNLGLLGVLAHLLGDAINNIGVIIAAAIMWKVDSEKRFYADPAISLVIGLIIFGGAIPLTLKSARVLLEAAPKGMDPEMVREDLMSIPGVVSIHDLHLWHLNETDALASFHVAVDTEDVNTWLGIEKELRNCFAAHGVTHVTIAPEFKNLSCEPDCGVGHK